MKKIPDKKREEIYSWTYDLAKEPTDKRTQMRKLSHVWELWQDYVYFIYGSSFEKGRKFWVHKAFMRRFYEVYNECKKKRRVMTFKDFEISPSELIETYGK